MNSQIAKQYSYNFGIDEIRLENISLYENMCFISNEIEIGFLKEDEYIQLESNFNEGEYGSIEFYIIDGSEIKSILPINKKTITNEKIFHGMMTRFSIDPDYKVTIKRNKAPIDIDLKQAIRKQDCLYTIDYVPQNAYNFKPKSSTIKVKAIIRTYDKNAKVGFIKNITIKKFGGSSLWNNL